MKVSELIETLQGMDPDLLVVMAADAEGNGFSPLNIYSGGLLGGMKYKDNEIGLAELTEEDEEDGYGEEDVMEGGEPCIVLWP